MRTHADPPAIGRWRVLAVTAAIATAALMGACDNDDTTADASASPTFATPEGALLAALPNKDSERYAFTLTNFDTLTTGVADPAADAVQLTYPLGMASGGQDPMKMTVRIVETDAWSRFVAPNSQPLPDDYPDTWLHGDRETVAANSFDPDPADPVSLVATMDLLVDVTEPRPGKFTGTLDLSKAHGLLLVNEVEVSAVGEKAKAISFEAEVDSRGRLTSFTLDWPAASIADAHETTLAFSDYGSAPAITAPPANETREAPESRYSMLD